MAIADVFKVFRFLKNEGILQDYLVFGSVAAMAHTRPFYTRDVDIGVVVRTDEEYWNIFERLAGYGEVEGHSIVICGTAVEIFPADISPIIQDATNHAFKKLVEGVMVKVTPPEHLLVEALRVNRPEDRGRVFLLDEVVDEKKLRELLGRLDHDGTLKRRYQALTGKTP
jgi:hypothetical protein